MRCSYKRCQQKAVHNTVVLASAMCHLHHLIKERARLLDHVQEVNTELYRERKHLRNRGEKG